MSFRDHTHWDTPHSVGLLRMGDRPETQTPTRKHTVLKRKTPMPPSGFKPTIPVSEQQQINSLDLAAAGIGKSLKFHKVTYRLFLMTLFEVHMSYKMMKYKILHNSAQR
jgi:hypothetical protein